MTHALCISFLKPTAKSGVTTYYKKLEEYFRYDKDIQITVVTIADAHIIWKKIAGLTRKILHFFSFGNRTGIRYAFEVKNRMLVYFALVPHKNFKFDIIHAQDILSGHVAKKFFNYRLPLLLTCHFNDNPVEEDMLNYNLKKNLRNQLINKYRNKFNCVDKFIFVSEYAYQKASYLLNDNANVKIIRNGASFSSEEKFRMAVIENKRHLSIINTGYIDSRKNQKILLPIAQELIGKGFNNFKITLVGTGPELNNLKELTLQKGLNTHFRFMGWRSNIQNYLDSADLYIHTAVNDNCPYSVIEAIASKIPAIGFSVGGLPEILENRWLFPVNDVSGIVAFILNNIDNLPKIASEQFERIKNEFSLQTQFEGIRELYTNKMDTGKSYLDN